MSLSLFRLDHVDSAGVVTAVHPVHAPHTGGRLQEDPSHPLLVQRLPTTTTTGGTGDTGGTGESYDTGETDDTNESDDRGKSDVTD